MMYIYVFFAYRLVYIRVIFVFYYIRVIFVFYAMFMCFYPDPENMNVKQLWLCEGAKSSCYSHVGKPPASHQCDKEIQTGGVHVVLVSLGLGRG